MSSGIVADRSQPIEEEALPEGSRAQGTLQPCNQSFDPAAHPVAAATRTRSAPESVTPAISIQAAIAITGRSQRTWWRHIEKGTVRKLGPDSRGRARIALHDVLALISCTLDPEQMTLLLEADAGEAEAQSDVGEMFLALAIPDAGRYWFELAAEQGHPNAMQCLARCYLSGEGGAKDENMALRWLAESASHGHVIAKAQMRALRDGFARRAMECDTGDTAAIVPRQALRYAEESTGTAPCLSTASEA